MKKKTNFKKMFSILSCLLFANSAGLNSKAMDDQAHLQLFNSNINNQNKKKNDQAKEQSQDKQNFETADEWRAYFEGYLNDEKPYKTYTNDVLNGWFSSTRSAGLRRAKAWSKGFEALSASRTCAELPKSFMKDKKLKDLEKKAVEKFAGVKLTENQQRKEITQQKKEYEQKKKQKKEENSLPLEQKKVKQMERIITAELAKKNEEKDHISEYKLGEIPTPRSSDPGRQVNLSESPNADNGIKNSEDTPVNVDPKGDSEAVSTEKESRNFQDLNNQLNYVAGISADANKNDIDSFMIKKQQKNKDLQRPIEEQKNTKLKEIKNIAKRENIHAPITANLQDNLNNIKNLSKRPLAEQIDVQEKIGQAAGYQHGNVYKISHEKDSEGKERLGEATFAANANRPGNLNKNIEDGEIKGKTLANSWMDVAKKHYIISTAIGLAFTLGAAHELSHLIDLYLENAKAESIKQQNNANKISLLTSIAGALGDVE